MARIVVADDDTGILESMRALLQIYGHEATTVADAREILDILKRVRPTLLLQDVNMPGLAISGHLAALRADPELKDLRIVLFSGDARAESLVASYKCSGTLPKPFEPDELEQTLAAALG